VRGAILHPACNHQGCLKHAKLQSFWVGSATSRTFPPPIIPNLRQPCQLPRWVRHIANLPALDHPKSKAALSAPTRPSAEPQQPQPPRAQQATAGPLQLCHFFFRSFHCVVKCRLQPRLEHIIDRVFALVKGWEVRGQLELERLCLPLAEGVGLIPGAQHDLVNHIPGGCVPIEVGQTSRTQVRIWRTVLGGWGKGQGADAGGCWGARLCMVGLVESGDAGSGAELACTGE
jgi:hypothetical protein